MKKEYGSFAKELAAERSANERQARIINAFRDQIELVTNERDMLREEANRPKSPDVSMEANRLLLETIVDLEKQLAVAKGTAGDTLCANSMLMQRLREAKVEASSCCSKESSDIVFPQGMIDEIFMGSITMLSRRVEELEQVHHIDVEQVKLHKAAITSAKKEIDELRNNTVHLFREHESVLNDLTLVSSLLKDSSDMIIKLVDERDILKQTVADLVKYDNESQIDLFKLELDADTLSTDMTSLIQSLKNSGYPLEDIKRMIRPNM